jgi:hypothetical protein
MQSNEELAEVYHEIAASLTTGLVRLCRTQMMFDQLVRMLFVSNANAAAAEIGYHPFSLRTDYRTFDDWYYISSASMLVYSTTLIDTFLSETMAFLYTRYPKSIGSEAKVSLTEIVEAGSKFAVINHAVEKRVRALGFESITFRLQSLERAFGVSVKLEDEDKTALESSTEQRNSFIHDQGLFRIYLDETGALRADDKACRTHPRPVTREIVNSTIRLHTTICATVYGGVMRDVLKATGEKYDKCQQWIEHIGQTMSSVNDLHVTGGVATLDGRGLPEDTETRWVPVQRADVTARN